MKEPDLHKRHRDKNGELSKKHGNTLVSTLRQTYGQGFAPGQSGDKKLSEVLQLTSRRDSSKAWPPPLV